MVSLAVSSKPKERLPDAPQKTTTGWPRGPMFQALVCHLTPESTEEQGQGRADSEASPRPPMLLSSFSPSSSSAVSSYASYHKSFPFSGAIAISREAINPVMLATF